MSVERGQDRCSECGIPLTDDRPCPNCGSTKKTIPLSVSTGVGTTGAVQRRLLISWHEVDRLLTEEEYAAALLVAAVNVEFILEERLIGLPKPPKDLGSLRSIWGEVNNQAGSGMSLASLFSLATWYAQDQKLSFSSALDAVEPLKELRRKIAHERGYFAKLTQLNDADWPETRIRQVLADAKAFCHGNAP